jgi:hypothetical protein
LASLNSETSPEFPFAAFSVAFQWLVLLVFLHPLAGLAHQAEIDLFVLMKKRLVNAGSQLCFHFKEQSERFDEHTKMHSTSLMYDASHDEHSHLHGSSFFASLVMHG